MMQQSKVLTYSDAIKQVMLNNGYFAPLKLIYSEIWKYKDKSKIKGKTPDYTINVQVSIDESTIREIEDTYGKSDYLAVSGIVNDILSRYLSAQYFDPQLLNRRR